MMRQPVKMTGRFPLLNCCFWPPSWAVQSAASSRFETFSSSNSLFYPVDSVFACFSLEDSEALKARHSGSIGSVSQGTAATDRGSTDAPEHSSDRESIGSPDMGPNPCGFSDDNQQRDAHEEALFGGTNGRPLFSSDLSCGKSKSGLREWSPEEAGTNPNSVNADASVEEVDESVMRSNARESQLVRTSSVNTPSPDTVIVEGEPKVLTSNVGPCPLPAPDVTQEPLAFLSVNGDKTSHSNVQQEMLFEMAERDETTPREIPTPTAVISKSGAEEGSSVATASPLVKPLVPQVDLAIPTPRRSMSDDSFKPLKSTRRLSDDPLKSVAKPSSPVSRLQSPRKEWAAAVPQPHYSVGNARSHPHTEDPFTCPPQTGNACYLSCGFENNGTMKLIYAHDASSVKGRILGFARISSEMLVPAFKYKQPVVVGKSVYKDALYAYSGVGALVRVARRLGAEVTLLPLPPGFPAFVVAYNFADETFKVQCPGEGQPKEGTYSSVLVNETCSAVAVADPRVTKNVHTASRVSPAVFKLQFASKTNESLLIDFRLE